MTNKEYIAQRVNKNCTRASCLLCAEADKYPRYNDCPYLPCLLYTSPSPRV